MTEQSVRNYIAVFFILTNFTLIIGVFILYIMGGFKYEEMTTCEALILPMFSGYTIAIVKHAINNRSRITSSAKKNHPVNGLFVFVSFLIPILFVLMIGAAIVLKAFNRGFHSFEEFKTVIALAEAAFASYVGWILAAMFREYNAHTTAESES